MSCNCAYRVDELCRRQRRPALLTLIPVRLFIPTFRTGSLHVAVGQKHIRFLIKQLLFCFFHKSTFFVERSEEIGGCFEVSRRTRSAVVIKQNPKLLENSPVHFVIAIYNLLWRNPLFFRRNGDRYAVFIRPADMQHIFTVESQKSGVQIGGKIGAGKVSEMDRPVRVGKGRGDKSSLEHRLI